MTPIALRSNEPRERVLLTLAVMGLWSQHLESTRYDQLVHRPTLKSVAEGAAPLSEVALATEPVSGWGQEYDFEPRLVFNGSIQVAGVVPIELPGADWDY